MAGLDVPVEVQIRTQFMHDVSQTGYSSHWLYKRKGDRVMLTREQQHLLEEIVSLNQLAGRKRHVYCLSPAGKLLQMPQGTTVSQLAAVRKADPAFVFVNGRRKPPTERVRDGDVVEFASR